MEDSRDGHSTGSLLWEEPRLVKRSGGWKIPETVVPQGHCSGKNPGWLNGSHPNVGEGEVTRTVCFTVDNNTCYWSLEIRVKNCSGYFVYWLWSTPWYYYAVYCTEPLSDTTQERQGSVTGEPVPGLTTSPAGSVSSDLETSTLEQSTGLSTGGHTQELSSVPAGDTSSDSQLDTTQEPQASTSGEPSPDLSSTPAWSSSSEADPQSDSARETQGSATGDPGSGLTSTPAGSVNSDLEASTMDQPNGSSTGQPTPSPSSVSAGQTSSVTDSALGDPCVTHTVLDQSWRSTDCVLNECTGGQWMGDGNLAVGWYRFNSSGGWKIPETVVPQGRCSGEYSGWLKGSHPKVEEEEVTRTICFTVGENTCYWRREIRVKNCSGYFVYRLWPTPSSNSVYCTGVIE
ncbi:uncharacterized protein [Hemitrygon akajei]|uniref:uncharacterized protein n=1 Tax=Hemitrygon akajei TaxID=2704970 RepID=UPI003BF94750